MEKVYYYLAQLFDTRLTSKTIRQTQTQIDIIYLCARTYSCVKNSLLLLSRDINKSGDRIAPMTAAENEYILFCQHQPNPLKFWGDSQIVFAPDWELNIPLLFHTVNSILLLYFGTR